MVGLQGKIGNEAAVEDGRGDMVEGVGVGVLENDDVHVDKADSAHEEFPEAAGLEVVYFGV